MPDGASSDGESGGMVAVDDATGRRGSGSEKHPAATRRDRRATRRGAAPPKELAQLDAGDVAGGIALLSELLAFLVVEEDVTGPQQPG